MRTVSDFRELNKQIDRQPFPIPKISTTLQELEGFTYAMALDLNMDYYTIRLDPMAVEMCTIIFPFGLWQILLPEITNGNERFSRKVKELKDQLVALKEAVSAQPKDPKETTVEAADKSSAALRAETKADLKIALDAVAEATTQCDKAAADMFQLYANLLSVNAR